MANGTMSTLVTGAAGFLGRAVAGALTERAAVFDRVTTTDCVFDGRVGEVGDLSDPMFQRRLFAEPVDCIFHLAGLVSGRAEADFEAGKRANLDASITLLEHCRKQHQGGGPRVRLIFASSIAVFGEPPPQGIDDATPAMPRLSYGAHKLAIEVLVDDYTRRGFIDGRVLRLAGVVVRPPLPNGALSSFNSDIFREPLAGRNFQCPLPEHATIWLTSLGHAVSNLLAMASIKADVLGTSRVVTAPALPATLGDIARALGGIDAAAPDRVQFAQSWDKALLAQFGSWPPNATFDRARSLALKVSASIGELMREEQARGALSVLRATAGGARR